MLFTIHCTFAPGAFTNAKQFRLEHYEFLRQVKEAIVQGGPLLGPDHTPSGMLMVVDLPDAERVRAFIAKEPYNQNGFFESVAIRQWAQVIPEPRPGYIEGEYQSELSSRNDVKP